MASEKMLQQRMRELELEAKCSARARRRLAEEKARPVKELVRAANEGNEGAKLLLDAMRQEMVKRGQNE